MTDGDKHTTNPEQEQMRENYRWIVILAQFFFLYYMIINIGTSWSTNKYIKRRNYLKE